jgi:lipopolysaccharide export system protein LptC
MKGKNLLVLVVLAVVLVGIAVLKKNREDRLPDVMGKNLLPALQMNDLEKIVVNSQGATVTLAKSDETWVLPEKHNYPANFEKIKSLLLKLADIKIGQVVQIDDKQKAELKMQPPSASTNAAPASSGTVVQFLGKGGAAQGSLLLGEARHRTQPGAPMRYSGGYPDGQYVSNDGGKSVYLIAQTLEDISTDVKAWLDVELLNVPAPDIKEIALVSTNGESLKLSKGKDATKLEVEGLGAKEETDSGKLSTVESALNYLRLDDVADPALDAKQLGMEKPATYKATTSKGEIYTVKIGAVAPGSNNRYVKIEVALAETNAPAAPAKEEVKAEDKDKAAAAAPTEKPVDRQEVEKNVKALNEKFGKWTYVVASYKTDAMLSGRKDIVKKKEEPKAEDKKEVKKVETPKQEPVKAESKQGASDADKTGKAKSGAVSGWFKKLWK